MLLFDWMMVRLLDVQHSDDIVQYNLVLESTKHRILNQLLPFRFFKKKRKNFSKIFKHFFFETKIKFYTKMIVFNFVLIVFVLSMNYVVSALPINFDVRNEWSNCISPVVDSRACGAL